MNKYLKTLLITTILTISTSVYSQYLPTQDFDNDGILNGVDIDDDNDGVKDTTEMNCSGSTCVEADDDGDGYPNRTDLDSDGDGCSDAFEAGATTSKTSNYTFSGIVGANGLINSLETGIDNGVINYVSTYSNYAKSNIYNVCADTDNDGIGDIIDIDDDNDGVLDNTEEISLTSLVVPTSASANHFLTYDLNYSINASEPEFAGGVDLTDVLTEPKNAGVADHWHGAHTITTALLTYNFTGSPTLKGIAIWNPKQQYLNHDDEGIREFYINVTNNIGTIIYGPFIANPTGAAQTYNFPSTTNVSKIELDVKNGWVDPAANNVLYSTTTQSVSSAYNMDLNEFRALGDLSSNISKDYDGDGIRNSLDLDSDNDGCSDAYEAGVTISKTANYVQPGPYGSNGLANSKETVIDNGVINYVSTYSNFALDSNVNACTDTDNDGIGDIIDIDDDNDGVLDKTESIVYTCNTAINWGSFAGNGAGAHPGVTTPINGTLTHEGVTYNYTADMSGTARMWDESGTTHGGYAVSANSTVNYGVTNSSPYSIQFEAVGTITVTFDKPVTDPVFLFGSINGRSIQWPAGTELVYQYQNNFNTSTLISSNSSGEASMIAKVKGTGTTYNFGILNAEFRSSLNVGFMCTDTFVAKDTDGDGIINSLDLDSDNDGCSDAYEAGATTSMTANYIQAGPYGSNGLANSKEVLIDNGVINYVSTYSNYALDNNVNACTDTDNDGIGDVIDIDDDNDGVLDIEENSCTESNLAKTGIIVSKPSTINYNFDGTQTLANLVDGIDANDYIIYNPTGTLSNSEWFKIELPLAKVLTTWEVGQYSGQRLFSTTSTYKVQGSNDNNSWTDLTGTLSYVNTASGQSSQSNSNIASFPMNGTAYKYYRYFGISGTAGGGWATEFHFKEKTCTNKDYDGDGIANHLDLDSDGDGCSDAYEAGATTSMTANYIQTGPYGSNGLANSKETVIDNGVINYVSTYSNFALDSNVKSCIDTDNDGITDLIDIDDDNDGITDTMESQCFSKNDPSGIIYTGTNYMASIQISNASVTITTPTNYPDFLIDGQFVDGNTYWYPTVGGVNEIYNTPIVYTISTVFPISVDGLYLANDWGVVGDGLKDFDIYLYDSNNVLLGIESMTNLGTNSSISTFNPFSKRYNSISKFIINQFSTHTGGGAGINTQIREIGLYITDGYCIALDTDGDGIANHLDLDSDNDGCSDAYEAGATTNTTYNFVQPGPYGSNGLANVKETVIDNGVVNYNVTYSNATNTNLKACPCTAGVLVPDLDKTTHTNICPKEKTNLNEVQATNKPNWLVLSWHTGLPCTNSNIVLDPTNVDTGLYYATFYDTVNNCFSGGGMSASPLEVTKTKCCAAGINFPLFASDTFTNVCPATTTNLSAITALNTPSGATLSIHSSTPPSASNKLSNLTSVTPGTYYATFYDATMNCYTNGGSSSKPIYVVNTLCCNAGTVAPIFSSSVISNICPSVCVDLNTMVSSNTPSGSTLTWHSSTPATSSNKISDVSCVNSGIYYASFYDATNNCYTNSGNSTTPIVATKVACCNSGTDVPLLSTNTLSNICPSTTANLYSITATNTPNSSKMTYHTSTPATLTNMVMQPNTVGAGRYYAIFYDTINNCFAGNGSSTSYIDVNIVVCCSAGTTSPQFSSNNVSNICPTTTANLSSMVSNNLPSGSVLTWHSSTPATSANKLSNVSSLGAGTYYASFYDATNNCYTSNGNGTTPVSVGIVSCCSANGMSSPVLSVNALQNTCPSTTVNLNTVTASNINSNVQLSWHTGFPCTNANKVSNSYSVGAGSYYASFYDATNNCYTNNGNDFSQLVVFISSCFTCNATNTPTFSTATSVSNTCPSTTYNLNNFVPTNKNPEVILTWHSSVPAKITNMISDVSTVGAGTYYAVYYDTAGNCFGNNGNNYTPVTVTINNCTPSCLAGMTAPSITTTTLYNTCPDTFVNLNTITATNTPSSTVLTWHSGVPCTDLNKVANPSKATTGFYYGTFYDPLNNCYTNNGAAFTRVTIVVSECTVPCKAGITAPQLSMTTVSNVCPLKTVNLNTVTSNVPTGAVLTWHSAYPVTNGNKLSNVSAVGPGTYYAAFYDATNDCYSGSGIGVTPVFVDITGCCNSGSTAPVFSNVTSNLITVACPITCANLDNVTVSSIPLNCKVSWHTSTPATQSNVVSATNCVASKKYYYATFYDTVNNCFTNNGATTTPLEVAVIDCDNDKDGVPDALDIDDDNDGIVDTTEYAQCTPLVNTCDSDGDGVPNAFDLDSDNDGINDVSEGGNTDIDGNGIADGLISSSGVPMTANNGNGITNPIDTDGDGLPNAYELDSDNDGILDIVESGKPNVDIDKNGMVDGPDTDKDGIKDAVDGMPNTIGDLGDGAPADTDGDGKPDYKDTDSDGDGIPDLVEAGIDPSVVDPDGNGVIEGTDTDKDGIIDIVDGAVGSFGDLASNKKPTTLPVDPIKGTPLYTTPVDTDKDGISDKDDLDDDNDGILDVVESSQCVPVVYTCDIDGDGIPNALDLDSDNDGIDDVIESGSPDLDGNGMADGQSNSNGVPLGANGGNGTTPLDTDNDNKPNAYDLDSDDDGINDVVESGKAGVDPDGNGMIEGLDTDGDGIKDVVDGTPNTYGDTNDGTPVDTDGDLKPDYIDTDSDNDGLTDLQESGIPNVSAIDPDGDGKINGPDVDGDGIKDIVDGVPTGFGDGLDASKQPAVLPDTDKNGTPDVLQAIDTDKDGKPDYTDLDDDNDGIKDVVEASQCAVVISSCDTDGDGVPNALDLDSDNDGINDVIEAGSPDTDKDGICDGTVDVNGIPSGANGGVTPPDTDGDTRPNPYDLDSDNDGINDVIESLDPTAIDADGDGIVDGIDTDGDGIKDAVDGNAGIFGDKNDSTPSDVDKDSKPNYVDVDSNNDGVLDIAESGLPNVDVLDANKDGAIDDKTDADKDGIMDVVDGNLGVFGDKTSPALTDKQPNGKPDVYELVLSANDDNFKVISSTTPLNIVANDTKPDNANVTYSKLTEATKGIATVNSDGTASYFANNANEVAFDSFDYQVIDNGTGKKDTARVYIAIGDPKDITVNGPKVDVTTTPTIMPVGNKVYAVVDSAKNGTVTNFDSTTGRFSYESTTNKDDSIQIAVVYRSPNKPNDTFLYWVYIKAEASKEIPNYISPNGDGVNDGLDLSMLIEKNQIGGKLIVFNRWGNVVWRSVDAYVNKEWKGQDLENEQLPEGVYYYMLENEEDPNFESFTGFVEIMKN